MIQETRKITLNKRKILITSSLNPNRRKKEAI